MDFKDKDYDYNNIKNQGTGSHEKLDDDKIII